MSHSRASQHPDTPDHASLRAQFEAEVRVAGIFVSDADREPLFRLWADQAPVRERLRAAQIELAEEPSFTQKPARSGGGVS
ncbi:MAG: hypothetical protein AB7P40_07255 [Chloroflexota bacterium]